MIGRLSGAQNATQKKLKARFPEARAALQVAFRDIRDALNIQLATYAHIEEVEYTNKKAEKKEEEKEEEKEGVSGLGYRYPNDLSGRLTKLQRLVGSYHDTKNPSNLLVFIENPEITLVQLSALIHLILELHSLLQPMLHFPPLKKSMRKVIENAVTQLKKVTQNFIAAVVEFHNEDFVGENKRLIEIAEEMMAYLTADNEELFRAGLLKRGLANITSQDRDALEKSIALDVCSTLLFMVVFMKIEFYVLTENDPQKREKRYAQSVQYLLSMEDYQILALLEELSAEIKQEDSCLKDYAWIMSVKGKENFERYLTDFESIFKGDFVLSLKIVILKLFELHKMSPKQYKISLVSWCQTDPIIIDFVIKTFGKELADQAITHLVLLRYRNDGKAFEASGVYEWFTKNYLRLLSIYTSQEVLWKDNGLGDVFEKLYQTMRHRKAPQALYLRQPVASAVTASAAAAAAPRQANGLEPK